MYLSFWRLGLCDELEDVKAWFIGQDFSGDGDNWQTCFETSPVENDLLVLTVRFTVVCFYTSVLCD